MKKEFRRKLFLNKKTVVNLNSFEMNHIKGGWSHTCAGRDCLTELCSIEETHCGDCFTRIRTICD